jgi:DnaJ-class molecular chaperone
MGGGPPGDALLEITVRDSKIWRREGNDLRMSVSVPLRTAVLGGVIDVATPAGSVSLKVPEGSNAGSNMRLRGKGVQVSSAGHLYVRLEIVIEDPKDAGLRAWAKDGA